MADPVHEAGDGEPPIDPGVAITPPAAASSLWDPPVATTPERIEAPGAGANSGGLITFLVAAWALRVNMPHSRSAVIFVRIGANFSTSDYKSPLAHRYKRNVPTYLGPSAAKKTGET